MDILTLDAVDAVFLVAMTAIGLRVTRNFQRPWWQRLLAIGALLYLVMVAMRLLIQLNRWVAALAVLTLCILPAYLLIARNRRASRGFQSQTESPFLRPLSSPLPRRVRAIANELEARGYRLVAEGLDPGGWPTAVLFREVDSLPISVSQASRTYGRAVVIAFESPTEGDRGELMTAN